MADKTYRKMKIDEDRYAAALLMARHFGNSNSRMMNEIEPEHITLMSSMSGHNLIFRSHTRASGMVWTVSLSIKGIKFSQKWNTLTNMFGKVIESFNPRTGERYNYPSTYNSAWANPRGWDTRVNALIGATGTHGEPHGNFNDDFQRVEYKAHRSVA
tara:strand:- start:23938 stop:24408 length:471 start_codon:yes stop_codon:yes gene_type:complete